MIPIGVAGSPSLTQLEPDDAEALRRFWSRLSPETRYRRFMIPLASLEASHLKCLLSIDHWDREAIVAREIVEVMIQGDNGAALGLLCRLRPAARLAFSQGLLSGTVPIGEPDDDAVGAATSVSGSSAGGPSLQKSNRDATLAGPLLSL